MMHLLLFSLLLHTLVGMSENPDDIVMVKANQVVLDGGREGTIHLEVDVKPGYHIQASQVNDEYLVPTTIEINRNDEFRMKETVFPPSKKFQLEGTDSYLDVYDERFEILMPFNLQKTTLKGNYRLHGKLKYQACDSVRCLFPRSVEFFVDVKVK